MAWTSMHFAVGMAGGLVLGGIGCALVRRGWRYLPVAMTAGGIWGMFPDTPRLFRIDFPSVPGMAWFADKATEDFLHAHGNLFFFHRALDEQPHEYALHGLFAIIGLYTAAAIATGVIYPYQVRRLNKRLLKLEAHAVEQRGRVTRENPEAAVIARFGARSGRSA